jgi:UDP-N-acetylglucosamine 2-epimerase (non-hydrolysing)
VTDASADYLWTPSKDGNENLEKEGVARKKITLVGNIMIDSLEMARPVIEAKSVFLEYGCRKKQYGLVTLHRPSNVDNPDSLERLCMELAKISRDLPLIFPVHPRTRLNLEKFKLAPLLETAKAIHLIEPLGYIHFMNLVFNARLLITDSGGVQEETTYLGIPCLTLRPNTERPVTITIGTNRLCTPDTVSDQVASVLGDPRSKGKIPDLWDGRTAGRVADIIESMVV